MEPHEGEPWPPGRCNHAACCLGYAGDHIHLLVTGGVDRDNKLLNDTWLFNMSSKKWREVRHNSYYDTKFTMTVLYNEHIIILVIIISRSRCLTILLFYQHGATPLRPISCVQD